MRVWKKQSVKWYLGDIRSSKGVKGAKPRTEESKRFYGTLKTYTGKVKQIPLTEDEDTSRTILERLQRVEDERKANGFTRFDEERQKPISTLLNDYKTHLESKGNTVPYVLLTVNRVKTLMDACSVEVISDLDGGKILNTLSVWRKRKKKSLSVSSSNHYVTAAKMFSRWLYIERRSPEDVLIGLGKLNAETDRRHVRRALTDDELKALIGVTQRSKKTYRGADWRLRPSDRVLLYSLAAFTGLRAKEIASLTPASFDLESRTLTVEASNTKNRKRAVLPLHSSLIELLRPRFDDPSSPLISSGTWGARNLPGIVFKRDLKRAKIDRHSADGKVLDFHSLRYTFITSLAKAGVHPGKAQRLARHSTVNLTMNVYTSLDVDDLRESVERI